MTAIIPDEQDLVGDVRAESMLAQWRIPFELKMVELENLKVVDSSQARDEANRAPQATVTEYALQMEAGAAFPPILVDRQGWKLLDGNTRVAAAEKIGRKQLPAYVVKCVDDEVRRGVAASLNQTGGKRLDEAEAMRAAGTLEKLGLLDEQVALYVGRSVASVRAYRAERRFVETAALACVGGVAQALPRAVKRKLGRVTHVEPFRELVDLATAGVRGDGLEQAVRAAETARSDAEAVEAIMQLRTELAPSQSPPPGGRTRVNTGARATVTLRKLLEQCEDLNVAALYSTERDGVIWQQGFDRLREIESEFNELSRQERDGETASKSTPVEA